MHLTEQEKSAENLERLYHVHARRYGNRLVAARMGTPGYREAELVDLVRRWEGVKGKGYAWAALSQDERVEVTDAILDERG